MSKEQPKVLSLCPRKHISAPPTFADAALHVLTKANLAHSSDFTLFAQELRYVPQWHPSGLDIQIHMACSICCSIAFHSPHGITMTYHRPHLWERYSCSQILRSF